MQTVRDVIDFVLRQERTVVFGNLGRHPDLLFSALRAVPLIRVVILTDRPALASTESRIRVQRPGQPVDRCDLLAYLEPGQRVEKHPLASKVAVFASHYAFETADDRGRWVDVCYFHAPDPQGTASLLARQDFPVQTDNVGLIEVDHANVAIVSGKDAAPLSSRAYVVVDLTRFDRDALSAYLAAWDAFDVLLENASRVDRWVTCFSENNRKGFLRFCQRVVDALFCRRFEHGNVTDVRGVLSLLPFFRSGVLEKTFRLKTSSFGGLTFAAPETVEEACKVAATHNVLPLVKNVLLLLP